MAKDWIQVRTALRKDPKVVRMVNMIHSNNEFVRWLTDGVDQDAGAVVSRNVTARVTCNALVEVWGAVNEYGERDGDDALLPDTTINMLAELVDMPGIGEAMALVKWAIEEEDEEGQKRVRFPRFIFYNTLPEDRQRSLNADRQKRFRDRHRNATRNGESNAKSNAREDKKRREDISLPLPPPGVASERASGKRPPKPSANGAHPGWLSGLPDDQPGNIVRLVAGLWRGVTDWTADEATAFMAGIPPGLTVDDARPRLTSLRNSNEHRWPERGELIKIFRELAREKRKVTA